MVTDIRYLKLLAILSLLVLSLTTSAIASDAQNTDFTVQKPYALNPFGVVTQRTMHFSWNQVPDAALYYFQLSDARDKMINQFYVYDSSTQSQVDALPVGEYKWRVLPVNKKYVQGAFSEWAYFSVADQPLKVENVFGIEKNTVTVPISTSLTYPEAAVLGPDGAMYVSDTNANVIKRCTNERCENYVGTMVAGEIGDGDRKTVNINQPGGIVFDAGGNLWFSDIGNRAVRKVDSNGQVTTVWKHGYWAKNLYLTHDGSILLPTKEGKILKWSNGTAETWLENPQLSYPVSFAQDGEKVYVVERDHKKLFLFERGNLIKSMDLDFPSSSLYLHNGVLYLGDHTTICTIDSNLNKTTFSEGYANVTNIVAGNAGKLLVTDSDSGSVFELNPETKEKTKIVGSKNILGGVVDIEKSGDYLYLLDNQAATVWKYDPKTGTVERFIGNGNQELATIGANRLKTSLFYPSGITSDNAGNFYISEQHHILKVDAQTGNVGLFAGPAGREQYGFNGDNKPAAEALFRSISGLDYDDDTDSLYVADTYNNLIRKVHNSSVSVAAGDGMAGEPIFDTTATNSRLNHPHDVEVVNGEVYIADSWNNTISKVDSTGIIHHIAGEVRSSGYQGNGGFSGDNGSARAAQLNTPIRLWRDGDNLLFTDTFNNRIRAIHGGKVFTIIGSEKNGYDPNNEMVLNLPMTVYSDDENVYVADTGNYLVRKYKKADIDRVVES